MRQFIKRQQPPDDSDVYLCVGVQSLFGGVFLIYPPAAYILLGLIFSALSFLMAQREAAHGTS